ncbi:hypothetical protein GQX73_g3575 [Xylaria multiplex]|uniref:Uncharacterized protein n=1 Tax=Xylaria multiplex TaxID=323545 RepID=A0A7C8IU47_9PEZI|nr:hypothetical protein GQX73_g3575 [Xylaria multiplex]
MDFGRPQDGLEWQYEHRDETQVPGLIAACATTAAASIIIIALRFLSRRLLRDRLRLEASDWLILAAWVFFAATNICWAVGTKYGIGRHAVVVTNIHIIQILAIVGEASYVLAIAFIKFSILALYSKIFTVKNSRYYVWGIAIIVAGWAMSGFVVAIFQCSSIDYVWRPDAREFCINFSIRNLVSGIINVATSIFILTMATPLVWGQSITGQEKWPVLFTFAIGSSACIISIVRLPYSIKVGTNDETWDCTPTVIISVVEITVGMLAISIPTYQPLYTHLFGLLLTTGPRNASINVEACQARGIPVAGTGRGKAPVPSGPDSTTQHTVALILALARNIPQDDAAMKSGGWQTKDAMGLSGKIFGTVGLGRLGVSVSRIMHLAFGMKVIAWSTNLTQDAADEQARAAKLPVEDETGGKTFKVVSRDELFSTADVVSIHVVLSERSRGLVGTGDLEKMKKSALLVNTSRGPIINEDELLEAGKKGLIRGIGLDVYGLEPLPSDSEWRTTNWGESGRSEVVMTPHMGYVVADDIAGWYEQQAENILRPDSSIMDTMEVVSDGSSSASGDAYGGGGGGGFLGPSSTPASLNNPQATTVLEGLNTTTLPAPVLPAPALPALPTIPSSVAATVLRSSARNHNTSSLLRGPIPQKGSGQDRFRQILEQKESVRLTTADQSNPFAVPTYTTQRLAATQPYSPEHTAVDPPLFTLRAATSAFPSSQGMDRAIATPSEIKPEMSLAVKAEPKDSSLFRPKPTAGEFHSQSDYRTVNVGTAAQNYPLATARLSAQCQLRHFNPKWHETSGPTGFRCSVQLINKVIHGDHIYPSAYDAKQAVAEKALVYVRRLPCEDPAPRVAVKIRSGEQTDRFTDRNRLGRAQVKKELSANTDHAGLPGQYTYATPASANAACNWSAFGYNENRALLHRIQSLFGGAGPSPAVLSDPLAAQAFLQGLAVGTSVRATSSVYEPYLEPQGRPLPVISGEIYRSYEARERSPATSVNRNYRDRSSPRRRKSYEPDSR